MYVSVYRFSSVHVGPAGQGMTVQLRGKASEEVPLLFASRVAEAYKCHDVAATIGPDGTCTATFSG